MKPPYFFRLSATSTGLNVTDGVEIAKEENQRDVDQVVVEAAGGQVARVWFQERNEGRQRRREHQQRRRENRRNDARGVYLQRQMRALAAVYAASDYSARVLNRNTPLRGLDINDAVDDRRLRPPG